MKNIYSNISISNFFLIYSVSRTKEVSSFPTSFMLFQNYPNPFNPLTTIHFNIPPKDNNPPAHPGGKGVTTKFDVNDFSGKEAVTHAKNEFTQVNFTAKCDASNYSSRFYFYKLITDEYKLIKNKRSKK